MVNPVHDYGREGWEKPSSVTFESNFMEIKKAVTFQSFMLSHMLNVWPIYLHLPTKLAKCR